MLSPLAVGRYTTLLASTWCRPLCFVIICCPVQQPFKFQPSAIELFQHPLNFRRLWKTLPPQNVTSAPSLTVSQQASQLPRLVSSIVTFPQSPRI